MYICCSTAPVQEERLINSAVLIQNGRREGNNLTQDTLTTCFKTSELSKYLKLKSVHTGLHTNYLHYLPFLVSSDTAIYLLATDGSTAAEQLVGEEEILCHP